MTILEVVFEQLPFFFICPDVISNDNVALYA